MTPEEQARLDYFERLAELRLQQCMALEGALHRTFDVLLAAELLEADNLSEPYKDLLRALECFVASHERQKGVAISRPGHDALWGWFSLSRASFLVLPRVLMHAMPDRWQAKLAALLNEYDAEWDLDQRKELGLSTSVNAHRDGKFVSFPDWVLNYLHPDLKFIDSLRAKR